MPTSSIVFSAQFGGSDAAEVVLPHFRALKSAAKSLQLSSFSFSELAYILRVDGEINSFGLSGAGEVEVDSDGKYIAVDVNITLGDRAQLKETISTALLSGIDNIKNHRNSYLWEIDYRTVRQCLQVLCSHYECELANHMTE